jgi:hypothetical protein
MIYAIQAGESGPIKIGKAKNPSWRIKELQTGQHENLRILAVADIPDHNEQWMHNFLAEHRIRGEWFADNDDVRHGIRLMMAYHGLHTLRYSYEADVCPICALEISHAIAYGVWTEEARVE